MAFIHRLCSMNVSGTLNAFKLLFNPSLCLPHASISNFNHLPIPLSVAFASGEKGQQPDIRAVILDKDNCFARPKENVVYEEYKVPTSLPHKSRTARINTYPSRPIILILFSLGSFSPPTHGLSRLASPDCFEQCRYSF